MITRNVLYTSSALTTRIATGMALAALVTVASTHTAQAAEGANVTSGQAAVSQTDANNIRVNQNSQNVIINWADFDTTKDEGVEFVQPNTDSIALNRVTSGKATSYSGELIANGQVWVVNPDGVAFGKDAQVNVGGLVATTVGIDDEDFNNGDYTFDKKGTDGAVVSNAGAITAKDAGIVALVGDKVENSGTINAKLGTVALGASENFTLDMNGDGLMSFDTGKAAEGGSVSNSGAIQANGGNVLLSAGSAKNVLDNAVNTSGTITAQTAGDKKGSVTIDGGNGKVEVSGAIDVSGAEQGEQGGTANVFGDIIDFVSGGVDASGDTGGGKINIGGDENGVNSPKLATQTTIREGVLLNNDANRAGDGGDTYILSDDGHTEFKGKLSTRGGTESGDGGFTEISSFYGGVIFKGGNTVRNARAEGGKNGYLYLDPGDVTIWAEEADYIPETDDTFINNVELAEELDAGDFGIGSNNNIYVNADVVWNKGSGVLTLNAGNSLFVNAVLSTINGGMNLNANNNVNVGAVVRTTTGNIWAGPVNGAFSSAPDMLQTDHGTIRVRQNPAGSLDVAVDSIGSTGPLGALIEAANGTFDGDVSIDRPRITLKGAGRATIINGGVSVNGVTGVDVHGVTIAGSGFSINNGSGAIQNSHFTNGGVALNNAEGSLVFNNTFDVVTTAIGLTGGTGNSIRDNIINSSSAGIDVRDTAGVRVANNTVNNSAAFGINILNTPGAEVDFNSIANTGSTGISIANSQGSRASTNILSNIGGDGLYVENGSAKVVNNTIDGVTGNGITMQTGTEGSYVHLNSVLNGSATGISNKSSGTTFVENVIDGTVGDGINNFTSDFVYFYKNTVRNALGDGIDSTGAVVAYENTVESSAGSTDHIGISVTDGEGTFMAYNVIQSAGNGIYLGDSIGSTIYDNDIYSYRGNGIEVVGSPSTEVSSNELVAAQGGGIGIRYLNSSNADLDSNVIQGGRQGIVVEGSDSSVLVTNNVYDVSGFGITVDSSNGTQILSNSAVRSGETGLLLNNLSGTIVDTNTIDGAGGNGITVSNAPGNRLINNRVFNATGNGFDISSTGRGGAFLYRNSAVGIGGNGYVLNDTFGSEIYENSAENVGGIGFSFNATHENRALLNVVSGAQTGYVIQNLSNTNDKPFFFGIGNTYSGSGSRLSTSNNNSALLVVEQ